MGAVYSAFSTLPVPDTAASNDVPYWISQLVAAMDARLVLTATSTTDRDSKFFNAPSGVVCVVRDPGTKVVAGVYVKTSDTGTSVWEAMWTAPVALTPIEIPLADGFQTANGKPPVATYNERTNEWTLYGNVSLINGLPIATSSVVASLPAAIALSTVQPYYEGVAPISAQGTSNPPAVAKITIFASGSIAVFMGTGVAANWVGFDLIKLPGA